MKNSFFRRALICCLALFTVTAALSACDGEKGSVSSDDSAKKADFTSIAGTWLETESDNIMGMSVDKNGTYTVILSSGALERGTIKIESEEHPDGTSNDNFSFYDENGDFWAGFPCEADYAKNPPAELWSGQDGAMHFERVEGTDTPAADEYVGSWASGRCSVDIVRKKDLYQVSIYWSGSASEYSQWVYSCTYDEKTAALVCDGKAIKTDHTFTENGKEKKKTVYKDGSGSFQLRQGILTWTDNKENAGNETMFLRDQVTE